MTPFKKCSASNIRLEQFNFEIMHSRVKISCRLLAKIHDIIKINDALRGCLLRRHRAISLRNCSIFSLTRLTTSVMLFHTILQRAVRDEIAQQGEILPGELSSAAVVQKLQERQPGEFAELGVGI